MQYAKALKKAIDQAKPVMGFSRDELHRRIARITEDLKGPLDNADRISLCAMRSITGNRRGLIFSHLSLLTTYGGRSTVGRWVRLPPHEQIPPRSSVQTSVGNRLRRAIFRRRLSESQARRSIRSDTRASSGDWGQTLAWSPSSTLNGAPSPVGMPSSLQHSPHRLRPIREGNPGMQKRRFRPQTETPSPAIISSGSSHSIDAIRCNAFQRRSTSQRDRQ